MKLRNLLALVSLLVAVSCTQTGKDTNLDKGVRIVPKPVSFVENSGSFTLDKNTVFVTSSDQLKPVLDFFITKINTSTGFGLIVTDSKPSKKYINVVVDPSLSENQEAYKLSVSKAGVDVTGSSEKGAFYGLQTLLQLLPPEIESPKVVADKKWQIPAVEITDEPRFKWRGMHLDVCRHFIPVENIKKHLDVMAMFKMNKFHWHLTEDQGWRIEIKKFPLLTQVGSKRMEADGTEYGGFYTQEQVKEIVAYAQERMIEVVPEIELPGHALGALTAYPNLSCTGGPFKVRNFWGVEPDVFCAGKEETFEFLEDVIEEVVALFPSEYFHIGGDECPKVRWEKCKLCQKRMKQEGLANEHELQSYFVKRIEKVLLGHGKKMIGWDEILEGGLAESATVMSWRGEKGGIEAATQGHDVVMTPGNWCYLDHYQGDSRVEPVAIGGYTTLEESYSYEPVPEKLDKENAKHILGTQGNVWTEYMYTPEIVEYRVYPRIIALAEVNWSTKENRDYENFLSRMDNQFARLDQHSINYHIPLPEGPANFVAFTDTAKVEFTTTRPVKMVYTLDGSAPTPESAEYKDAFIFTENASIKIATVLSTGKMSKVRTIAVEKQSLLPARKVSGTKNGLREKYTLGAFVRVNELDKVKDWKNRISQLETKKRYADESVKKPVASILTGYIEIAEDAIFEFSTNLDQFYLGGKLLINNDGDVKRFSRNNTTIALEKGLHEVKLVYMENNFGGWPQAWNGYEVNFRIAGEEKFQKVTPEMYSYK